MIEELDRQRESMDAILEAFLDGQEEDAEEDHLPSVAELEAERGMWRLHRPEHLDLFVLWQSFAGMGGESLYNLWRLSQEPGSVALLRDMATLNRRITRLKRKRKRDKI